MSLSVTSWPQAVDYRIVYESAAGTTANTNATGSTGTIKQIKVDNSQGSQAVFLKVKDGLIASVNDEPDWLFRVGSGEVETISFQECGHFSAGLSFWATRLATVGNNTAPAVNQNGTVKVTFVVHQTSERINVNSVGY